MIRSKCFTLLACIVLLASAIPEDNIVIGIYTQEYIYDDYSRLYNSAVLTYIGPTNVNIAAMTGAKVVPIFSYTSQQ
jgi:hypothetical protein